MIKVKESNLIKVLHFVSANGSVETNGILQQYVDLPDERKELTLTNKEKVRVYQIKRSLIQQIRSNRNIRDKVTFYTQSQEEDLKEMVFPKSNAVLANVKKAVR